MFKTSVKNSVIHFSRWGNKSFSAFSSLHRVVKVCVLSSAYFMSLGLPSIIAQSDEPSSKEINLEEVEVNAEANVIAMESELTRVIAVVSKSEIERSSAQSLAQLLKSVPGIDVRQRGAHSTQADLSIRAGSFDQVLILLNGINISDPQTGHNNLNIPISLNSIERIEVLEGAGLRYNTEGAFAGAINIVTKTAEKNAVGAEVTYGDFNFLNTELGVHLKQKNLTHALNINYTSSDGYRDNTDFDTKRIFYTSAYKNGNTKADFQLGYLNNAFGANSFYSAAYPNQFEEVSNVLTSLKVTTGDKVKIMPKVYYKRSFDRFELFRDNEGAASWYGGHNYHQIDVWGAGSDFSTMSDFGKTNLGLDFRSERVRSTNLGEDIDPIEHPREDSISFKKEKQRMNFNAFLNHTYYWQDFVVSGNVLVNYNGISEKLSPYLGLDVAYKVSNKLSLKASVNESFRMPTFTELYYTGPTNIGNADLKQEKALTMDLGVDYNNAFVSAHASVFHRRGKDIIDWVRKDTSQTKWQTMNYSEVNTTGFEATVSLRPGELYTPLTFVKNVNLGYTHNYSESKELEYISYYAMDYLKNKFTVSADFTIYKQLTASFLAQYQERQNETDAASRYEPFWLCDASIRWEGEKVIPFVEVSNIFDKTYYDFSHLPQAGRWAMIGIKVKL